MSWLPVETACSILYLWGLFLGALLLLSVLLTPLPLLATGTPTLLMECWAPSKTPFSRTTGPGLKVVISFLIFFMYASPGSTILLAALTPPRSILGSTVVLRMKVASSARASTGGGRLVSGHELRCQVT